MRVSVFQHIFVFKNKLQARFGLGAVFANLCLKDQITGQELKSPALTSALDLHGADGLLEPDLRIICSLILSSKCMCGAFPPWEALHDAGVMERILASAGTWNLEGAPQGARPLPGVQNRELVCSAEHCRFVKVQYDGQGALCIHLSRAPEAGSVLESRACPDAAVRCRFAGALTGSTPTPSSFRSTFLCRLHEGLQATERPHQDKPHRADCGVPERRCRSLPFAPNVSSAASPQQLTSVCVLSFFSREPSCPGRFLFYI